MIIVRDSDTPAWKVRQILQETGIEGEEIVLDSSSVQPGKKLADSVLFIATMPSGWLGYHRNYFEAHKGDDIDWIVILLNSSQTTIGQAKMGFAENKLHVSLFAEEFENADWEKIGKQIKALRRKQRKKALLYSVNPDCGKKTMAALLRDYLPKWEFETAWGNKNPDILENSDASEIIIMGRSLEELAVHIPEDRQPYYVLSKMDENVQILLQQAELPGQLLKIIPAALGWTKEKARERLFCVSPLYETWKKEDSDPHLDERFVMWDEFGLPLCAREYTEEKIRAFLRGFDQCEQLTIFLGKNGGERCQ